MLYRRNIMFAEFAFYACALNAYIFFNFDIRADKKS